MIHNCLVKMHYSHLTMRQGKFVNGQGVHSLWSKIITINYFDL